MVNQKPKVRRHWQFDWRLVLFSGTLLPVLLVLGSWQLDRASEKQHLLDRWQQQSETLSWVEHLDRGLEIGQPVELVGRYDKETHWLLDNRTRNGVPGYEVLTVFYPNGSRPVVINRGWLAGKRHRDELPTFTTPQGLVTVRGRVSSFPEPPVLAESAVGEQWPRRVQALSPEQAKAVEGDLVGVLVRLSGHQQPGALQADWAPNLMGPQTHYGYAAQWFSLAVALTILTLIASYRKKRT